MPSQWLYVQTTGELFRPNGTLCGVGYSGRQGEARNNPAFQTVASTGPLPQGLYYLGAEVDHPMLGPCAIPLLPNPANKMFGRSHFWVHGDNVQHDASEGCIIMARPIRNELGMDKDGILQVVDVAANRPVVT